MSKEDIGFIGQEISALKKDQIRSEKELESSKNHFAEYLKENFSKEGLLSELSPSPEIDQKEDKKSVWDKLSKIFSK